MLGLIMSLISAVLLGIFITTAFICDNGLVVSQRDKEIQEMIEMNKEIQQKYRSLNEAYDFLQKNIVIDIPEGDK